jgi:hypothetical protein
MISLSRIQTISISVFLFIFPLLIGFQPYLPELAQEIFIVVRYILIPIIIIYYIKKYNYILWLSILFIYLTIALIYSTNRDSIFIFITYLNLLSSYIYYLFGLLILKNLSSKSIFRFLTYGVSIFNIITLGAYILVVAGIIDISYVFNTVDVFGRYTLERFSFGNSIELPFAITSLLMISLLMQDRNKSFFAPVLLNLLVTMISGSRILFLLALVLLINEFLKLGKQKRVRFVLVILVILFIIPLFEEYFSDSYDLLIERYSYFEFGSSEDRSSIYKTVFELWSSGNIGSILFGNGITSSSSFMLQNIGSYRSMESLILQLIFEIGIVGVCLYISLFFYNLRSYFFRGTFRIASFLVIIQLLFFLPIFTFMQIPFLLIGLVSRHRIGIEKITTDFDKT